MDLGFKALSPTNCLEPDEMIQAFVTLDASGVSHPIEQAHWAAEGLGVALSDRVPGEVPQRFAIARGAMLYGYFFYPLLALASEQLLRASDSAVAVRCREMQAPPTVKTFDRRIDWLREGGHLSEHQAGTWHAVRKLRNSSSHPAFQMILMPGMALSVLQRTAEDIESLFSAKAPIEHATSPGAPRSVDHVAFQHEANEWHQWPESQAAAERDLEDESTWPTSAPQSHDETRGNA